MYAYLSRPHFFYLSISLLICQIDAFGSPIRLYPSPQLPASNQYSVDIFDGTQWLSSYVNLDTARTDGAGAGDEAGKTFSWTTFEIASPTPVRVRRLEGPFSNVTLRPLRLGLKTKTIDNSTIEFIVHPGQKISVEFDTEIKDHCYDSTHGIPCIKDIMMIFADSFKTEDPLAHIDESQIFRVPPGTHQKTIPVPGTFPAGKCTLGNCSHKPIIYFGPGVYDIGYWQVPNSISHIHIAGGAVVFGAIDVLPQGRHPFYDRQTIDTVYQKNWQNERLRPSFALTGSGILSGAKLPWHLRKDFSFTSADNWWAHVKLLQMAAADIQIEDITLANSPHWNVTLLNDSDSRCHGLIDNLKLVGAWTYNNDGIPNLGNHSIIRNCFIHANDDALKLYNSRSTIENCVIWQSCNGAVFQHGWFPKTCGDITVSNIDVIHFENWNGDSANRALFNYADAGGHGTIRNVVYSNINIEGRILRLFGFRCQNQVIENFTFNNLHCDGMGMGTLGNSGQNYFSGTIRNFHFNNFVFDGQPVTHSSEALFEFTNGADESSFYFQSRLPRDTRQSPPLPVD